MASDKTPRDLLTESFKNFYITIKEKFAAIGHTHAISDVIDLQSTLNGKAASSHTHTIANVSGLQTALDGKAPSKIGNASLVTVVNGKANSEHTHSTLNKDGMSVILGPKGADGTTYFMPSEENAINLGTKNNRWLQLMCLRASISADASIAKLTYKEISSSSDRNLKNDIVDLPKFKNFFMNLRPVSYKWKDPNLNDKNNIGFIAQEIKQSLSDNDINPDDYHIVSKDKLDEPDEFGNTEIYSLCYTEFIPIITQVLQDTVKEVESLKSEIADLKSQLSSLTSNE